MWKGRKNVRDGKRKYTVEDVADILKKFIDDSCDTFPDIDKTDLLFYASGWALAKLRCPLFSGNSGRD